MLNNENQTKIKRLLLKIIKLPQIIHSFFTNDDSKSYVIIRNCYITFCDFHVKR